MKVNVFTAANRRKAQKGLTLIELLVVLLILAAVAGVALTILPNFQRRTHGSTSAASIRAGETAITADLITGGEVGNQFDGLITAAGAVPAFIANAAGLEPQVLDSDMADALNELGVDTVFAAVDDVTLGDENATLDGHDYTTTIAIADTETVAALPAANVATTAAKFNIAAPDEIFAFGLGEESTLVGLNRAFKEAPLHTPGEGSAATRYGRYAILIGYETGGEAFYIGMTCIDDFENFNNITDNLGEFFEANG